MSERIKIFGERLRCLRIQAGLSQEVLAERAGIHTTYVGQLERGEKNPTVDTVMKLCRGLGVPIEQMFAHLDAVDAGDIPAQCYELVRSRPEAEQKELLALLKKIIAYRNL